MTAQRLPRSLLAEIEQRTQKAPHAEVCGLIAASPDGSLRHYPIANISETPEKRFEMDPAEQIAAFRSMREAGEELYAVYHSHPGGPAVPSDRDRTELVYPQALQLVIGVQDGRPETRAWRLDGEATTEIPLERSP